MTALAFDTHQFVKELTSVGFTEAQAEAVTSVVKQTRAGEADGLALRADLQLVEANLRRELAETRADLLRWMVGLIGLQTIVVVGSIAGLLRALVHA